MSIFVVGLNYKTAPISVREKVFFAKEHLSLYLQDLLNQGIAREAILISTCNRSELYCEADNVNALCDWFCEQTTLSRELLVPLLYVYQEEAAIAHIMQVACGLDSMILGEPQILGQIKDAFAESCSAGAINNSFHRLFQQVFTMAKEIRTTTAIGACPVSVASAAVHFAKKQYENFAQANIVLIGAGDTTELLLRYLKTHFIKEISIVNRSLDKAVKLAEEFNASIYELSELNNVLKNADIVFSATGSVTPLVTKEMMLEVLSARDRKPLILIDIAVPRDIDPAVKECESLQLFCIDDLKAMIETHKQGREHAALKAKEMIRQKSIAYMNELHSHEKAMDTIRVYRSQIEDICRTELRKAKLQLQQGVNSAEVLESFANAFTQKLLHIPSVQLRQAAASGKFELLSFAKQLFAIPDPETERL